MNRRDYQLYLDGREAAARGSGLSDDPYGGRDGFLWRQGVQAALDETGALDAAGLHQEKLILQETPGGAISQRPLS